ncbi:MAG TPA: hypothetical protein VLW53_05745, partial [Candidatus Eisenbacteria bacterium]|nr:hypothetical protein [Candidatus Eisenbacteria bacterium]
MNRLVRSLVALGGTLLLTLTVAPLSATASAGGHPNRDVLAFDTAFANVSPFIGPAGAIRGVTAAPLPWAIRAVFGDLDSSGRLIVVVRGLVLADDPAVPANLRGTNPVPDFAAVVSCLTASNGAVVTANVTSANFPASPQGNAVIHQVLALPQPCAAPDVFITSPNGGVWFAATGAAASRPNRDVLAFHTAFANVAPFIGAAGAISGVTAAPLPWAVRSVRGDLDANGQLDVDVDHLVLANDPAVPANLRGTNPVPDFAA